MHGTTKHLCLVAVAIGWAMWLHPCAATATDPPTLLNTKTDVTVTFDAATGIYNYRYAIANPSTNTGQIWSIDVEMLRPEGGAALDRSGIQHEPGAADILEPVVSEELAQQGKTLVPVGLSSPRHWGSGPSVDGTVGWGSNDAPYRIQPGQRLDGFGITSRGLPGIRAITIYPKVPYDLYPREDDPPEEQARKEALKEDVAFKGKTIAPTAPPATFVATEFVTYLESLKHQAQALGWITNEGVVKSLDVKLDQARKHLQAGSTKTAGNVIQAFMNEVSAQGCSTYEACPPGKHLTPEASGLLYFNAHYLLDHL